MYKKVIKRLIDILCAVLAITVFSWLYIIVAILVRVKLGSPVIFRQKRPGLNGKIFEIYKFRTMIDKVDVEGNLLPDEQRLTRFGLLLRRTSLDELPEVLNILKGDMSVVGPRPLLVKYLPLYNEHQMKRHNVRPGMTGLAQISGRNLLSWEDRFDLDVKYVNSVSFMLDLKIVFLTVWKVFKKEGISATDCVTMQEFTGNETEIKIHD